MADILSQLGFDDLLGGGYEEEDSDSSDSSGEPVNTGERKSLAFKGHIKPKHIKVPYVSPVLKREEMLLNPDSNTNNNLTSVPVVRTLQNYKQYKGNIYKK